MTWEKSIDRVDLRAAAFRCGRWWVRLRPRRLRHRADGIGDLALRAAAVARRAAGSGLFGDRAKFDAALDLEDHRLLSGLAVPDRRARRRPARHDADRAGRSKRVQADHRRLPAGVSAPALFPAQAAG